MSSASQLSSTTPTSRISSSAWIANGLLAAAFAGYCIIDAIEWGGRQEGYAAAGVAMTATLVLGVWALVLSTRALRKGESFWNVFMALATALALLNAWVIKTAFFGSEVVLSAENTLIDSALPVFVPWFSFLAMSVILVVRVLSQRTRLSRRALMVCAIVPVAMWIFFLPVPLFVYLGYGVGHLKSYPHLEVPHNKRTWMSLLESTPEFHAELGARGVESYGDLYARLIATGKVSEARLVREVSTRNSSQALNGLRIKNPRLAAQHALPMAMAGVRNRGIGVALGAGLTIDEMVELLKCPTVVEDTKYLALNVFDLCFPDSRTELAEKALAGFGVDHDIPYFEGFFFKDRTKAEVLLHWTKFLAVDSSRKAVDGIEFYAKAPEKFRPEMFEMLLERGTEAMLFWAIYKQEYKETFKLDELRKIMLRAADKLDDFAQGKLPPNPNIPSWDYTDCISKVARFTGLQQEKAADAQISFDWVRGTFPDAQYKLLIQNFCQKLREKLKEEEP